MPHFLLRVLLVGLGSLCTHLGSVRAQPASTGPWDVQAIQAAEVKPEWGESSGKAREVYYPGEAFQGQPTRVFAYYAKPATGDGPFPAILLVHGGGGTVPLFDAEKRKLQFQRHLRKINHQECGRTRIRAGHHERRLARRPAAE